MPGLHFQTPSHHPPRCPLLAFAITHCLCDGADCYEAVKAYSNLLSNQPTPAFAPFPDAERIRISDKLADEPTCSEAESQIYYQRHVHSYDSGFLELSRAGWRILSAMIAVKLGLLDVLTTKFIHLPRAWVENLCIKA
jgi:hypothetical protein